MTSGAIEAAVQQGVYTALAGDTALTAMLADGAAGVTAFAAPGLALPYVMIAATASRPAGTQGHPGDETDVTLEIYSQKPGGAEARLIAAAAAAAVCDALSVEGHAVELCRATERATRLAADGVTYQTRLVLRIATAVAGEMP